jgi:hypothetical protein
MDIILGPLKNIFGNINGDSVDMSLVDMGVYTIVPFGQLIMRLNKFGGSLDKPYLLLPFFFFPPFSIIPVLMAKFGMLKKSKIENIIDIYIVIPIIFRFILIFTMALIGNFGGPLLQISLILISLIAINMYRSSINDTCKKNDAPITNKIIKNVADSMAEYSIGILTVAMIYFIPFINIFLDLIGSIPFPIIGNIGKVMNATFWSIGLVAGYVIVHMYDATFSSETDACSSKIYSLRTIISVIAFAISIFIFRKD